MQDTIRIPLQCCPSWWTWVYSPFQWRVCTRSRRTTSWWRIGPPSWWSERSSPFCRCAMHASSIFSKEPFINDVRREGYSPKKCASKVAWILYCKTDPNVGGEGRGTEISQILRTSLAAGSLSHAGIGIFPLPLVTSSLITIRDWCNVQEVPERSGLNQVWSTSAPGSSDNDMIHCCELIHDLVSFYSSFVDYDWNDIFEWHWK